MSLMEFFFSRICSQIQALAVVLVSQIVLGKNQFFSHNFLPVHWIMLKNCQKLDLGIPHRLKKTGPR